jgi:hypothetical protein
LKCVLVRPPCVRTVCALVCALQKGKMSVNTWAVEMCAVCAGYFKSKHDLKNKRLFLRNVSNKLEMAFKCAHIAHMYLSR